MWKYHATQNINRYCDLMWMYFKVLVFVFWHLFCFCLQIPVALLIAQFAKDGSGEAVPLGFSDVVNLFHEFGHVVRE